MIPPVAVILAAGKGTRMQSDLPKVCHPIGGRPMVCAVVDACLAAGCQRVVAVVGYKQELVREALASYGERVEFAVQDKQNGTGHAVRCALPNLKNLPEDAPVYVLCGDGPLIRSATLRTILDLHLRAGAAATLATSNVSDPTGYGRIVRGPEGRFRRIVEHAVATEAERRITEINPSYYCFRLGDLRSGLAAITPNSTTGEEYVTDVPESLMASGRRVEVIDAVPPEDVLSINTPAQLAEVDAIFRSRTGQASQCGGQGMHHQNGDRLRIFAGRHMRDLAEAMCGHLGIRMGEARTHVFPDGEMMLKVEEDVRGRDCFIVLSTCMPVNDNLMELLIFLDCLRRASAETVTVVLPYFGYARQDRKSEGRVPITAKLVANLLTASKADRIIALDLHAAQIQGFFDIPVDHLSATPVFSRYFKERRGELGDLCMVSPDVGNVKVAEGFANMLGGDLAIINKRRLSGDAVETGHIIGNVKGKTVLMVDDMISTAGTICAAAEVVMQHGARGVIAAASHGLFVGEAFDRIKKSPISRVVVTNSIPPTRAQEQLGEKLVVLDVSKLLGEAVSRVHHKESVSALFEGTAGFKR